MELVETDRALLIICDTTIYGTTRLQKYGFLISKQFGKELADISFGEKDQPFYNDWEALWYGPFSKGLQKDVDECARERLIYKEPIDTNQNTYQYGLTTKGRIRWRKIYAKFTDAVNPIHKKVMNLQKVRLERLLERIYTAYPEYTKRSTIKGRFS